MKRVDIVLINPPGDFSSRELLPHYGIGYLASSLKKENLEAVIIDGDFDRLTVDVTLKRLERFDPLTVGIYSASSQLANAVKIASTARKITSAKIILGGPHVSFDPEVLNKFTCFDYGIRGEGEISLPKLIRRIKNSNDSPRIIEEEHPEDLDKLPFPQYDLFQMEKARIPLFGHPASYIFISRGCPFNCTFCSIQFKPVRYRSARNIVAEMLFLKENYRIDSFFFQCGTFTLNRDQILSVCREIKNSKLVCKWGASTRCDLIDEPLVAEMKMAGCVHLNFGIESGSHRIRKMMKKDFSEENILSSYELCKKYGIRTACFWLFGYPTETSEDFKKTLELSLRVGEFASFAPILIFPGTELYKIALSEGKITKDSWYDFATLKRGVPIYIPEGMSAGEILNFVKRAYLKFYLRGHQLCYLLRKMNRYYLKVYLSYFTNLRNVN